MKNKESEINLTEIEVGDTVFIYGKHCGRLVEITGEPIRIKEGFIRWTGKDYYSGKPMEMLHHDDYPEHTPKMYSYRKYDLPIIGERGLGGETC